MAKAAWFPTYGANERTEKFDRVVQSWDTANKASELRLHPTLPRMRGRVGWRLGWGLHYWVIKGKGIYLLHVLRRAWNTPS
jgi:hypothetical protein